MIALSRPVFAFIELTPACNNRCLGCGNVFSHAETRPPLDVSAWRRLLDTLQPHVRYLKLTGGEPTLHPDFERIIQALAARHLPFSLFTNARWSNPAEVLDCLSRTEQCQGLLVSLHGSTSASHDAFTGVAGSWHETLTNIERAVSAGQNVTTSTVITSHNWREVEEIVGLSRQLGANHAVFNRYLGLPHPDVEPTSEHLRAAVKTIERLHRHAALHTLPPVRFGNCIPQCWEASSAIGCLAGIAYATIDPWGNMRPCNHAPWVCGNLLEDSLVAVWNGAAMQSWRQSFAEQCLSCAELARCHGGCRALAMLRGQDKDPLMRAPLSEPRYSPTSPPELRLYDQSRPICHCTVRAEDFGYVLLTANQIIPVEAGAKPIIDACDGSNTLKELQQRFGQPALDFVGFLAKQGVVELAR